ncbi:MAG: GNAT family N-acetyltransferase [Planctomycetota bacterium]
MSDIVIRPVNSDDGDWIAKFISERWGAEFVVAHNEVFHCRDLPGFVATDGEEKVGLVTYKIVGDDCEIISLDSLRPRAGIGTGLIDAVKAAAIESGWKRLWLVTTNDNMNALRFYQKRGFVLVKINRNAVEFSRKLKPIPLIGADGIPLRDEIELEMTLGEVAC